MLLAMKRKYCIAFSSVCFLILALVCSACSYSTFDGVRFTSESVQSGNFQLENGIYKEPAAPGSTSFVTIRLTDHIVYNTLGSQESAAVILTIDSGGSGTFYHLYILKKNDNGWQEINSHFLGDRISIEEFIVEDNTIKIKLLGPAQDEPITGKGLTTFRTFSFEGDEIQAPESAEPKVSKKEITIEKQELLYDKEWAWQQSIYNNDTKVEISQPEHYTLQFHNDGRISARIDCNRAGGMYTIDGHRLTITITHSTRAMCPPESSDTVFIRDLEAVSSYFIKSNMLYLEMRYDTGTMFFEPLPVK
jgi:heat shock protein HslJ